mgnify:CR=1 FL=1
MNDCSKVSLASAGFLPTPCFEFDFFGSVGSCCADLVVCSSEHASSGTRNLLVLDLDGTVVESDPLRSISADLKSLMKSRGASTRLIDVTEALRFAGSDERIAGVIIKVDGLTKLGLASARTIGSAIEDYKTASGKPVFSWASGYTQAQYAAAAHADVVALHPMGSVMVKGLSGTTLYWGGFWKNSALECPS